MPVQKQAMNHKPSDRVIYLRESPHWVQLKREKMNQVGRHCQVCPNDHPMHGHHIRYKNLIDCTVDDILMLCEDCHNDLHTAARFYHADLDGKGLDPVTRMLENFRKTEKYLSRAEKIKRKRERKRIRRISSTVTDLTDKSMRRRWSLRKEQKACYQ
jgi:hypothetical protein